MALANAPIRKRAVENPVGIVSIKFRKPDQYIHPWMFGQSAKKKTGLWLFGLPKLRPTNIVPKGRSNVTEMPGYKNRSVIRSETYEGIARAMAAQWGAKSKYAF